MNFSWNRDEGVWAAKMSCVSEDVLLHVLHHMSKSPLWLSIIPPKGNNCVLLAGRADAGR